MPKCGAFQGGSLLEFGSSETELGTESNESCVESKCPSVLHNNIENKQQLQYIRPAHICLSELEV